MPPFAGGEPAGRNWASSVHGFKLLFGTRGQYDTGFEKCMLPGNINGRIATFANKHEGFDRHLFLKTGEFRGENRFSTTDEHRCTQIFEQPSNQGTKVKAKGGKAGKRKGGDI